MTILTEPETTIPQNMIYVLDSINPVKNISAHASTASNNMNDLFGIFLFQNRISDLSLLEDSTLPSTYSPTLKPKENVRLNYFQNVLRSDVSKNPTWIETGFYTPPLKDVISFPKSDKKINNTWLDFDGLLKLSPIVPQAEFIMSKDKEYPLRQTISKPSLDNVLLGIPEKFDVSDIKKLKNFISSPMILEIPNLPERLDKIISHVSSFIQKLDYDGKSKIDVFCDEEIENFQSITIEYAVKNATSDQCIKWTESLVSEIITIDENMLDIVQVEIIPDDI